MENLLLSWPDQSTEETLGKCPLYDFVLYFRGINFKLSAGLPSDKLTGVSALRLPFEPGVKQLLRTSKY